MTISSATQTFFDIFSSFWGFITANPILCFCCFAPVVLVSLILLIKAFR